MPISHYCEKARWALDRAALPYREERHVQAIHRFFTLRAGGGLTVPVLVTPHETVRESAHVVAYADRHMTDERRLLPSDTASRAEVESLCRRFDEGLGPSSRRLLYVQMLPARELTLHYNNQGLPRWEDQAVRRAWPVITGLVKRVLAIEPGVEVQDEADVFRELDFVAGLLADGRPYLCGDRFTAADLTFASLAAPMVVPPEYAVSLPQPDVLPAAMADIALRARRHPAGRHALRMFTDHRHEPTPARLDLRTSAA
jgi:glutathione S-transferase